MMKSNRFKYEIFANDVYYEHYVPPPSKVMHINQPVGENSTTFVTFGSDNDTQSNPF